MPGRSPPGRRAFRFPESGRGIGARLTCFRADDTRRRAAAGRSPGRRPTGIVASISENRQRQILALLLGAFAVLSLASVATFEAPLVGFGPWSTRNACGPV